MPDSESTYLLILGKGLFRETGHVVKERCSLVMGLRNRRRTRVGVITCAVLK